MEYEREREAIIACCLRMGRDGLTVGTSGNISVKLGGRIIITPSGVPYDTLTPSMLCVIDRQGCVVDGDLRPSTEEPFHRMIYQRSEASAIVHTHGVFSTAAGTLCDEVPAIHYMMAPHGGPVRVAEYARFGSKELVENIERAMVGRQAVLLRNHGAVCWGNGLEQAYTLAQYLEWICKVWVTARSAGSPRLLSDSDYRAAIEAIRGK